MYVFVWICAHTSAGVHGSQEGNILSLEAEIQVVVSSFTGVMKTGLGSLARAGLTLNNGAISPVLFYFSLFYYCVCVCIIHTAWCMYRGQRITL